MTPDELISQGRMLKTQQVLRMWPVSRQTLWRACNTRSEADRLPSYKVMGTRLFKYDELMWYLDKHKTKPNDTFTKKTKGAAK